MQYEVTYEIGNAGHKQQVESQRVLPAHNQVRDVRGGGRARDGHCVGHRVDVFPL